MSPKRVRIERRLIMSSFAVLGFLLGQPAAASCPAPADTQPGVFYPINFDVFPNPPGGNTPAGLVVTGQFTDWGACFDQGLQSKPTLLDPTPATASNPHALVNDHGAGDIIGSRNIELPIYFTVPMESVSMKIGWGFPSPPAWNCETGWPGVTLTAYGRTSSDTIDMIATTFLPGPLPESVTTLIQVAANTANNENITSVRLDYGDCFLPEMIDDLGLTTSSVPPLIDNTPPVLTIDQPVNGQVFNSDSVIPPVTGTVVEDSGIAPQVEVNGVLGLVASTAAFDTFTFSVPGVPLPTDGLHTLTATATDGAGLTDVDTVDVNRLLATDAEIVSLRLTQTGIIDPPQLIVGMDFIQNPLIQGKITLARGPLSVTGAGGGASYIDAATLEVLDELGSSLGVVNSSTYSFPSTAGLDCAPLLCGVNFFIPGDLLRSPTPTVERRFRVRYYVGATLLDEEVLGPFTFKQTSSFEILMSPVELPWDPSPDVDRVLESLDLFARTYPTGDDFALSTSPTPAGVRDFTLLTPPPIDLDHGFNPPWEETYKHSDIDFMKVTWDAAGVCTDTGPHWNTGLRIARQASYPEDLIDDDFWDTTERARFCPHVSGRLARTRNTNLKNYLYQQLLDQKFNFTTIEIGGAPLTIGEVDSIGMYTNASTTDNTTGSCGGSGGTWAANWGGNAANCVRVVVQEYGHNLDLGHSRDKQNYNGTIVDQLPGCTPEVNNDDAATCTGIIPTLSGAGYNLLDRSATSTPHSYMTTRTSGDNYLNCYLRNEEFRFLAQNAAVGWYTPPGPVPPPASGPSGPTEMATDPWRILGTIDDEDETARVLWAGPAPAGTPTTDAGSGIYNLTIKDVSGGVLLTHVLDVEFDTHASHPEPGTEGFIPLPDHADSFNAVIDLPMGAERFEIETGGSVLWSVDRGLSPPSLSLLGPGGGETFAAGDVVKVEWSASDADAGAPVFVRLDYSPDGGDSYIPLGTKSAGETMAWPTYLAPGGTQGQIRVTASDGFDVSTDVNPTFFTLEDSAPLVRILSPLGGRTIFRYQPITLRGIGYDPEEGMLIGDSPLWISNRDGLLGRGPSIEVFDLSPGPHTIELSVTDSALHTVVDTVTVNVDTDTDRDGLSDNLENDLGLDPFDPSDARQDNDDDGLSYIDEVFLGTNETDSDTDGDGLNDGDDVHAGGDPNNDDTDGDGFLDGSDNCLLVINRLQTDGDGDGAGDECDNCIVSNPGQQDFDRDGLGDACDTDDDDDGVEDVSDCAPTDPFAFAAPGAVTDLKLQPGAAPGSHIASWTPSGAGSGAFFDVAQGFVIRLPTFGFSTSVCLVNSHPGTAVTLPNVSVPSGAAVYFLIRERNACGLGGWGAGSNGIPRVVPACP